MVILPAGKTVPSDFSISFYDDQLEQVISASETTTVTNYEYEDNIQTNKRNIFLLKQEYIPVVIDDVEDIMSYRKGSTQYMSRTLKRADNIRLYE